MKDLNLIKKIIDFDNINDIDFYNQILITISKIQANAKLAVFFYESTSYIVKAALDCNNKSKIDIKNYKLSAKIINSTLESKEDYILLETKQDKLLDNNTLILKLSIKESVFGFLIVTTNNTITSDTINYLSTISKVLSYKIKDYELNEVFKIQLKAIQDAYQEKENAYSTIKKQHSKLQEIDKTKNLFLANISHELRTPLNAIIGFSQALDSKIFGELNEKQAEYIKDIQISGLHLLGMINEILDLSKIESNVMKFCPSIIKPNSAICEVINILEPLYNNKNIKIIFKDEYKGDIYADNQKFQQILYNLLSNAIKFTSNEGKIEIEHYKKDKNYILKIKDNGIGIEKKYHSRIFKKFVHLNNTYTKNNSSTGLGLTITKELVKLHKGKITLESELNKGSCFTMEFSNIIR